MARLTSSACLLLLLLARAATPAAAEALRVCADPANLPQSNAQGEGYENKIAAALAHDLNRTLEYTYFPQRMGFVRNTLRARDEATQQFKCDLIIGVPSGYELTATTRPYLHSTYALVFAPHGPLTGVHSVAELLALPAPVRATLRIGVFARTPAADWVLQHALMDNAVFYAPQSGDPNETPESIVERDLSAGTVDAAVLWGPIAGYLAGRHGGGARPAWMAVPFPAEPGIRFDYEIAMGVRFGEQQWLDTLNVWIAQHQLQIDQILAEFHVPVLGATPAGG
ncbi:MAG TPA: quinoprotein dehydrogenase-associated putative ABC transporter substrate-binding protein [Steroidobacteraceae bacterium]|jgi:quinoprotein dehydrogenase-associated probable ABC transporter substrate-binding protein